MAQKFSVTVGAKAYSFYDQSTGINIIKGEIKELTPVQFRSKRVQMAINSGHLMLVQDPKEVSKYSIKDITKMYNRMKKQLDAGMEIAKIAKSYTLQEAKLVAKANDVQVEDSDTVESILKVLLIDGDDK